jgi:hypothetical protein
VSSRKDTGRVDAEGILQTEDQLLEEVSVPYLVVWAGLGTRTVAGIRLVASLAAANSLDIYSDGERVQARFVESSLSFNARGSAAIAMESKNDRRCLVDVVVLRDVYQVGPWDSV